MVFASALMAEAVRQRVIGIVRTVDAETAAGMADALIRGGLRSVEISLTNPGGLAAIGATAAAHPEAIVGAGSVLDGPSAVAAIRAGARFLVTPVTSRSTIAAAARYGVPVISGAATPTEMLKAMRAGAAAVKLFPARGVAPEWVADVRAALPALPIVPTGGVEPETAVGWLRAGAVAVAMGTALSRLIEADPAALARLLQEVAAVAGG